MNWRKRTPRPETYNKRSKDEWSYSSSWKISKMEIWRRKSTKKCKESLQNRKRCSITGHSLMSLCNQGLSITICHKWKWRIEKLSFKKLWRGNSMRRNMGSLLRGCLRKKESKANLTKTFSWRRYQTWKKTKSTRRPQQ